MPEISSKLLQKIRKIQFATIQLADEIMAGAWHSAFKGQGMEFEEVREYQSGDDVRMIDWHVTARMDRPYMKVFREERELTVFLIVDVSASSRFGSQNQLKRDVIAEIGAVLAFSAIKNNDKVGLILFSDRIEKYVPPGRGTRHVLRVIRELLAFEPQSKGTDLRQVLSFLNRVQRRAAICFVISDFICPEAMHEFSLTAHWHDLIAICVTDPYELDFPISGLVTITDLETGASQVIDTTYSDTHKLYHEQGMKRLKDLEEMMEMMKAGFIDIRIDKPYIAPIHKFFKIRQTKR